MSDTAPIDLGRADDYDSFPALVVLDDRSWFLTRNEDGFRLLSTVCPHAGGEVANLGEVFQCPHHGWTFSHSTGECLNAPARLSAVAVEERDGRLLVELPSAPAATGRRRTRAIARAGAGAEIRLLAHACLEINRDDFSLLTDPWLWGPAFLGAWTHYPPRKIDPATVNPSAIWISHEHSDHLHEPTLERLDRSVPVYVPDFPNRRMVAMLERIGFEHIHAMPFGETTELAPGVSVTAFEPGSFWNDAAALIEIDGFRILNLNDAGVNRRIAAAAGPVDVVASSFSQAASSYPIVWRHLEHSRKREILEQGRVGALRMIRDAAELYGARWVLPFASHFALWPPQLRSYQRMIRTNTVDDVVAAFSDSDVGVIDILPGESFNTRSGEFTRHWRDRTVLYAPERIERYLEQSFDEDEFMRHHPQDEELSSDEVRGYLLRLNRTPEIAFCENLVGRIVAVNSVQAQTVSVDFEVRDGGLRILDTAPREPNLLIEVPAGVLARIARDDISWDETDIGFWCKYERAPDFFHAGFWRVLHAPYYRRRPEPPRNGVATISTQSVIAEVIENHGPLAERIIRRYGLYCAGCRHSTSESIELGARQHGIESEQVARMVRELNEALLPARAKGDNVPTGNGTSAAGPLEANPAEGPSPTPIG